MTQLPPEVADQLHYLTLFKPDVEKIKSDAEAKGIHRRKKQLDSLSLTNWRKCKGMLRGDGAIKIQQALNSRAKDGRRL